MVLLQIGRYEDKQITELVDYDEYWDKYSYYQEHHDMYQELVNMWKMVFRKESSSRPSANELLHQKWMKEMELSNEIFVIIAKGIYLCYTDGESILYELVSGGEEQSCAEHSQSVEHENVGILISQSPMECSAQSCNDDELSVHSYSQHGRTSPRHNQSNSSHLNLSQAYHHQLSSDHSPTGSDSEMYYDCNSSFSGRNLSSSFNGMNLSEPHFLQPTGPSSLPASGSLCVCVCESACVELHCYFH